MKYYISSDHAGFGLKSRLLEYAKGELGLEIEDLGAFSAVEADDYPPYIRATADRVSADPANVRGIIIGGSGQGEAIAANRVFRVRAALFYGGTMDIVRLSREHNDANILSLGARFLDEAEAKAALKLWIETPFSGAERHVRRIAEIDQPLQ